MLCSILGLAVNFELAQLIDLTSWTLVDLTSFISGILCLRARGRESKQKGETARNQTRKEDPEQNQEEVAKI